MSDAPATHNVTELRTLVKGTPEKVTIKDKDGIEHELVPLDLADLIEYEDSVGHSLLAKEREFKLKDLAYLLYLSLRKEGLSPAQIEKRAFKVSPTVAYRLFDLKLLNQSNEAILDLLRVSGLVMPKGEEVEKELNPTPLPQPASPTS